MYPCWLANSVALLFTLAGADAPRSREFVLDYAATVIGLDPGQTARVWLPVPPTTPVQAVTLLGRDIPAAPQLAREPRFGNQILFFEAQADAAGRVPFSVTYRIKRHEVRGASSAGTDTADTLFLQPDALVPVGGKCLVLLAGQELPEDRLAAARALYDLTLSHMHYKKEGIGWGRGDAVWACGSGFGNCSDFHSLFIALVRAQKIPAKFEIGLPLPDKRGSGAIAGYHCWAFFKPHGRGWLPVDISEASKNPTRKEYYFGNLNEDRVLFTTGRDLTLLPKQAGPPLNFFIYPYAEVGGRPYPESKIERRIRFRDVE